MMPRPPLETRWWNSRRWREDRGDTAVQMAIVFPVVLLLTLAVIQAAMWFYARQIALTAAREGATAARSYQASPADGAAQAREVLGQVAGDSLRHPEVSTAASSQQRVQVTVSGIAQSLLPGLPGLRIQQSASGAVEQWTQPGEEQ